MAVNPATIREKNVRITETPSGKGVQVVVTIRKMDNGGVYINCGGPDDRPLGGVGSSPPSLDMAVNGIPAVVSIAVEELLKESAQR
ncbi:MAG TPA: hypothetical protein VIV12_20560 [Streptosporangiaceae bacterium]